MAVNESWLYLTDFLIFFVRLIIIFAMNNRIIFVIGLGCLLLVSTLTNSQITIDNLKVTPKDELINKLDDTRTKKALNYIISQHEQNVNNTELIKRGICPVFK